MTRLIHTIDRDMAEEAIKRAYERGREDSDTDAREMVHKLALEFREMSPDASVAAFAASVVINLLRGAHRTRHEGECLGSPRR
jgi:hypothetical protein